MWNLFYQWNCVKGLLQDRKGQGMVEYALILAVVAIVALVGFKALGTNTATLANNVAANLK
nr:Flp family type IVb pilin [uncultured Anaeromusa sp.]